MLPRSSYVQVNSNRGATPADLSTIHLERAATSCLKDNKIQSSESDTPTWSPKSQLKISEACRSQAMNKGRIRAKKGEDVLKTSRNQEK